MVEALKMFRAVAIELPLRLLAGISSRVVRSLRADAVCGVPSRRADEGAKGDALYPRLAAKGSGGRDLGVPLVAAATSLSPGRAKVTIAKGGLCALRWGEAPCR